MLFHPSHVAQAVLTMLSELEIFNQPYCHPAPLGFALASPLPLAPLMPLPMPPRLPPRGSIPPRLLSPDGGLDVGAGVANFDVDFEDGGFSMNEVSVVLESQL